MATVLLLEQVTASSAGRPASGTAPDLIVTGIWGLGFSACLAVPSACRA
ncbi:MAG: hypothetical protein R2746_10370 [Acidimicrobiales bacterium]